MRLTTGLKLFQNVTFSRYLWGLSFITVLICVIFTASLSEYSYIVKARTYLRDAITPVLALYQSFTHTADKVYDQGKDILMSQKQLNELRDEIEELKQWKSTALSLMSENKALRQEVHALPENRPYPFLTARVLSYPSSAGAHKIIIQAGRKDGISEGLPVVTSAGLVGRIVDTGENSSEVLLITDTRSKIPVILEPIHQQAIVSGDQDKYLMLDHLENEVELGEALQVFTSGKGGNFPPGLYIGDLYFDGSKPVVQPAVGWTNLEYVQVLIFQDVDHEE